MTSLARTSPTPERMNGYLAAHKRRSAPHVWLATMADLPAMTRMGQAVHQESAHSWLPFDHDGVQAYAKHVIAEGQGYAALAADAPGAESWGCIAGLLAKYPFYKGRYAADLYLYVAPERRNSWAGLQALIAFVSGFRSWAKMQGAVEFRLGITTGIHTEATGRLYERLGLERMGLLYGARI